MSYTPRYFRPGQALFREGDPSTCMYLVKRGTISIRKYRGTAFFELAKVYSNEVLGELSFLDRNPRSATAIALSEVEVWEIQFASLDKVYKEIPDYLKTIIAAVADRLRKANDTIRRLQKNLAESDDEDVSGGELSAELDAASVLAATSDEFTPSVDLLDAVNETEEPTDVSESDADSETGEKS